MYSVFNIICVRTPVIYYASHVHTHTHTLSLSHTHTHTHSLTQTHTHTHITDESSLYISPTLISGVNISDAVMLEEVFGPLLPFVTVDNMDQAIQYVRER